MKNSYACPHSLEHGTPTPQAALGEFARRVTRTLNAASDTFLDWQERHRQRRALSKLDDRMLRDIGISRADADSEYRKPFWRA